MISPAIEFEKFCKELLEITGYNPLGIQNNETKKNYDYLCRSSNGEIIVVEVKFYQSTLLSLIHIHQALRTLQANMYSTNASKGILITTGLLQSHVIHNAVDDAAIEIWDHRTIYKILEDYPELLQRYSKIIRNGQFFKLAKEEQDIPVAAIRNLESIRNTSSIRIYPGKSLCQRLNAIPVGKAGAIEFEKVCQEALEYIFSEDFVSWKNQAQSQGGLHRFDLIARISSDHDLWRSVEMLHRTRYVVFEFKNYEKYIGQNEIYRTEKYLYPNAMRSVAIIIARNGASKNAISAANGAIRENGKIIIILSLKEVCNLLNIRDQGGAPSDRLAEILDDTLMHIER